MVTSDHPEHGHEPHHDHGGDHGHHHGHGGDHGHDEDYVIIVNGTEQTVHDAAVTYEQVVAIAFPKPPSPDSKFTVTFRKADAPKEGSLSAGMSVEVKHRGTIFNVKATGKS